MRKFALIEGLPKDLREGMKDGLPICLGYISVSFAFGMRVALAGMPVWIAGLISLSNLTSAGQFAGVNLLLADGSYLELIITTLIINTRYFLMSMSLSQKVNGEFNTFRRLSASFGVTDEIFAVSMGHKGKISPLYMCGLIMLPVFGWTTGTIMGGIASGLLPETATNALGIALYAMFMAIIIPPAREKVSVLAVVLAAAGLSVAFDRIPALTALSGGWSIVIITILVASIAAILFPVEEDPYE